MYKILITTDGSEHSMRTVQEAIKIAVPMEAEVTVLSVVEDRQYMTYAMSHDIIEQIKQDQENMHKEAVEKARQELEKKGIKVKTMLPKGHPADVICDIAEKEEYDLIILGSKGLGKIQEFILGSVSNRVVHCAKNNVMVVK